MLAIIILLIGIISRLIVHTPNFTPVLALALFGGMYLNRKYAIFIPLVFMILTDTLLGLHNIMFFTWGSILLISLLGFSLRSKKSFATVAFSSIGGAILFFVITNFGAWLAMYPLTLEGLKNCFVLAIPFFRSTLASALIYSVVFYSAYEGLAHFCKKSRWATLLLTAN